MLFLLLAVNRSSFYKMTALVCFQKIVEKGKIALAPLLRRLNHFFQNLSHPGKPQPGQAGLNAIKDQGIAHIRTSPIMES